MSSPPSVPVPEGTRITLDAGTRTLRQGRLLLGGRPRRVLRLSEAGMQALAEIEAGPVRTTAGATLARRLLHAGLAHPHPIPPAHSLRIVTIVPVRDRAADLDRCLTSLGNAADGGRVVVVDDGSRAPGSIAATARRHHADLVVRATASGPAAARNTGLAHIDPATTDAVAFLDSDCQPPPDWAQHLARHLTDPAVGAVAPRIVPTATDDDRKPSTGYLDYRCALDLGANPGNVEPGGAIAYVPTAALLVRTTALPSPTFDEALRYGEDVDAVWRIIDAGWHIRYDPAVRVPHASPTTLAGHLGRRFRYGTSAGPLARRHPARMAPITLDPWTTAAATLLLLRRPAAAGAAAGLAATVLGRRLARLDVPATQAVAMIARAVTATVLGLGRTGTQLALPAALLPALTGRHRARRAATAATLVCAPWVVSWIQRRPTVGMARWVGTGILDDVAYGAGVWLGALRARTPRPLLPRKQNKGAG